MSYHRSKEDKRRLKKLHDKTKNKYGHGVWYDEDKGLYLRYNFNTAFLKRQCSKVTRRKLKNNSIIYEKGYYKKLFEYWWSLF